MKPSREWDVFFRIPNPSTTDKGQALDPAWCQSRGINTGAEVVLRLLRDEVIPFIKHLKRKGLVSYHFLIHDRQSGVPVEEDDKGVFIHLRMRFKKAKCLIEEPWVLDRLEFTQAISGKQTGIGGLDLKLLPGGMKAASRLIELQSEWVLALVEAHKWKDDGEMVRQVQQFGHYFSNMLQMAFR